MLFGYIVLQGKRHVKQNTPRLTKTHKRDTTETDENSPRKYMYEQLGKYRMTCL